MDDESRWKQIIKLLGYYERDRIAAPDLESHLIGKLGRAEEQPLISDEARIDLDRALLTAIAGRRGSYADLKRAVDLVFLPRPASARCLTMHRAKGLEADRVFIIRPDLLPHRYAERSWQRVQEENLLYVSLTRAKEELYICHGEVPVYSSEFSTPSSERFGVWGTGFVRLRGQLTDVDSEAFHSRSRRWDFAFDRVQGSDDEGSELDENNIPFGMDRRQHEFIAGVCLHCDKKEFMVRQFGWSCG